MSGSFLDGLESASIDEIRSRRDECRDYEAELSYSRRLLQGKIDILEAELNRRAAGGEPGLQELVARLPSILSDEPRRAGQKRLLAETLPANAGRFRREAERLASDLAHIDRMSPEGLAEMVDRLEAVERKVSEQRRSAQHAIDELNAELVRRYKRGEADPTSLLRS